MYFLKLTEILIPLTILWNYIITIMVELFLFELCSIWKLYVKWLLKCWSLEHLVKLQQKLYPSCLVCVPPKLSDKTCVLHDLSLRIFTLPLHHWETYRTNWNNKLVFSYCWHCIFIWTELYFITNYMIILLWQ